MTTIHYQLEAGATPPLRKHEPDAGADISANHEFQIPPLGYCSVRTGLHVQVPFGMVGLIHPRSGLAKHFGVTVLNTPGTIDAGYTGEIEVVLFNAGQREFFGHRGDRIAQLVIQRIELPKFIDAPFVDTERGNKGFGSTGV